MSQTITRFRNPCGRRNGLVVSMLDIRIERSRFEPWPGHCVVFLGTQEYKLVLVNCQGNLTKCWGLPALD